MIVIIDAVSDNTSESSNNEHLSRAGKIATIIGNDGLFKRW